MPKPSWLYRRTALNPSDLDRKEGDHHGGGSDWTLEGEALCSAQDDAVRIALQAQEYAGIDIVSDGEQRRKSYLAHVTGLMPAFDYTTLRAKWIRGGRREAMVGRCVGPIRHTGPLTVDDLRFAKSETRQPIKVIAARPDDGR